MSEKQNTLVYLESLIESGEVAEEIRQLDEQTLLAVRQLVDKILERERAGLDSLFSSMTHTMKFIPNMLLQTLTARYIEPPIAARITVKLSNKQAVAVANGLKPDYVADTSRYMPAYEAAKLLAGMQTKKASKAIAYALMHHPQTALAIIECLDQQLFNRLVDLEQIRKLPDKALRERLLEMYHPV